MTSSADYRVALLPERHEIAVELRLSGVAPGPVELAVPTWVPGAYGFMKYARDLFDLTAVDGSTGAALPVRRHGWSGFVVEPASSALIVRYRAYGHDPAWGELVGVIDHRQAILVGARHLQCRSHAGPVTVEYVAPEGWAIHHPAGYSAQAGRRFEYPENMLLRAFLAWTWRLSRSWSCRRGSHRRSFRRRTRATPLRPCTRRTLPGQFHPARS